MWKRPIGVLIFIWMNCEMEMSFWLDLNSNKIWDDKRTLNHTSLVAKLKNKLDLTSAYHNYFNEPQGSESKDWISIFNIPNQLARSL